MRSKRPLCKSYSLDRSLPRGVTIASVPSPSGYNRFYASDSSCSGMSDKYENAQLNNTLNSGYDGLPLSSSLHPYRRPTVCLPTFLPLSLPLCLTLCRYLLFCLLLLLTYPPFLSLCLSLFSSVSYISRLLPSLLFDPSSLPSIHDTDKRHAGHFGGNESLLGPIGTIFSWGIFIGCGAPSSASESTE